MKRLAIVVAAILICIGLFVSFGSEPLAGNMNNAKIEFYSCGEKIGEWEVKKNSIEENTVRTCFNEAGTGMDIDLSGGVVIITGYRSIR